MSNITVTGTGSVTRNINSTSGSISSTYNVASTGSITKNLTTTNGDISSTFQASHATNTVHQTLNSAGDAYFRVIGSANDSWVFGSDISANTLRIAPSDDLTAAGIGIEMTNKSVNSAKGNITIHGTSTFNDTSTFNASTTVQSTSGNAATLNVQPTATTDAATLTIQTGGTGTSSLSVSSNNTSTFTLSGNAVATHNVQSTSGNATSTISGSTVSHSITATTGDSATTYTGNGKSFSTGTSDSNTSYIISNGTNLTSEPLVSVSATTGITFKNINSGTQPSLLSLEDADGSNTVSIAAPSNITGNHIITLPNSASGSAGNVCLDSDGTGGMVWSPMSTNVTITSSSSTLTWDISTHTHASQTAYHVMTENTSLVVSGAQVAGKPYNLTLVGHASNPYTLSFGAGTSGLTTMNVTPAVTFNIVFSSDGSNFTAASIPGIEKQLILYDADNSNSVTLKTADNTTANQTLVFPATAPTIGQVLASTDTTGTLTWSSVASGGSKLVFGWFKGTQSTSGTQLPLGSPQSEYDPDTLRSSNQINIATAATYQISVSAMDAIGRIVIPYVYPKKLNSLYGSPGPSSLAYWV